MSTRSLRGYGIVPDRAAFRVLARDADLVPVYREIPFDVETAVRCFAKLQRPPFGFLLESVVGGEKWARYSFLGAGAMGAWRLRGDRQETWTPDEGWKPAGTAGDPLAALLAAMPGQRVASLPGLPRFWGGAVGFFGYDTARFFERLPGGPPRALDVPDALMIFTDVVVAVDKLADRALVIAPALPGRTSPDEAYEDAVSRIDSVLADLRSQVGVGHLAIDLAAPDLSWSSTYEQAEFERDVQRIRDYIHAGDAFQVVLSQRLTTELRTSPFTVYRALRMMNPSPYLFFLDLDGFQLIGSSPEVMVRVEADRATVRPIAGTRPRGRTEDEDQRME
jgi:anthranilate synthase component 1